MRSASGAAHQRKFLCFAIKIKEMTKGSPKFFKIGKMQAY